MYVRVSRNWLKFDKFKNKKSSFRENWGFRGNWGGRNPPPPLKTGTSAKKQLSVKKVFLQFWLFWLYFNWISLVKNSCVLWYQYLDFFLDFSQRDYIYWFFPKNSEFRLLNPKKSKNLKKKFFKDKKACININGSFFEGASFKGKFRSLRCALLF